MSGDFGRFDGARLSVSRVANVSPLGAFPCDGFAPEGGFVGRIKSVSMLDVDERWFDTAYTSIQTDVGWWSVVRYRTCVWVVKPHSR